MSLYRSAIADILIDLYQKTPKKVLITGGGASATVECVFEDAVALAQHLHAQGFETGDRVAIATPANADFVKIMYALIFLKATVAIIDPEMGRDNYRSKLQQFNPKWAFVDSRLLLLQEHPIARFLYFKTSKNAPYFPYTPTARTIACGIWLPLLQKKIFLKTLFRSQKTVETVWLKTENVDEHEFLITYTSGTIAMPKGVVHTFGSLQNSLQIIGNQLNTNIETLMATYLPHYLLIAISVEMPSILYNPKLSAIQKLAFFQKNNVTTTMGPPSDFVDMVTHCENTNTRFSDSMQHIMLGSAPVTRRFLKRLTDVLPTHTRVTCLYGMTENLVVATTDGRFKKDYPCDGDLLGTLAAGVTIQFENDEILIESNQLFKRYFHLEGREKFHSTGDLGKMDENRQLILGGRKKDMIIKKNLNIYPGIYEATINRIDGVTEAVMVGIYDDAIHDERVYLVVEGNNDLSKKKMRTQLQFGEFSIDQNAFPDEIVFMKLPRSGRQHKVDKNKIRNIIQQNKVSND